MTSPNQEIIQWACKYLSSHGYKLNSTLPETVQETPWSYVARFTTSGGTIYLKHTPELLALEAPILQTLRDQFQAAVPDVIAYNAELHCFLMKDAGTSLRSILKQTFDEALGHYRLMAACDIARFTAPFQRHGRVSLPLKEFMGIYP